MKYILSTAAFALGASAGVLKQRAASSCCFGITVTGSHQSGSLGQLDDGQNRVGPGFGGSSYCIQGTTITDEAGRGCVIAEPSTQFQCDLNSLPTSGFSISSTGEIAYNGNTTFYECAATADNQYNVYITPAGAYCAEVTLTTTGGSCAVSSSVAPTTVMKTTTVSASTLPASTVYVTQPASTVTVSQGGLTTTLPGSTVTLSQPSTETAVSTVTLPASTVTVSGAGSTVTVSAISTVTLPASTVTVSGAGSTVTVSGAGSTVTLPGASCVASTVTIAETALSTVYSTVTVTQVKTSVESVPTTVPTTEYETETAKVTEVQTATSKVTEYQTVVQTSAVTEVQTVPTTIPTTAYQTVVETAPASTVKMTETIVQTQGASTVVSVYTTSIAASSSSAVVIPSSSSASATPTSSSCPPNLSGNYQYPHLIIPVNASSPNTAYGSQYFGDVSSTVSTIFNFDVPASYEGNTCSLIFLLPTKAELETSDYTVSGSGGIEVLQLSSPATTATTYANQPSVEKDLGTFDVQVGSSTVVATAACAAGETLTYELKATGSYALYFFEDYNPSPLGLYIREC